MDSGRSSLHHCGKNQPSLSGRCRLAAEQWHAQRRANCSPAEAPAGTGHQETAAASSQQAPQHAVLNKTLCCPLKQTRSEASDVSPLNGEHPPAAERRLSRMRACRSAAGAPPSGRRALRPRAAKRPSCRPSRGRCGVPACRSRTCSRLCGPAGVHLCNITS